MDFVKYLNLNPVLISADDLVELSSKNDSILDYELFKKTDQVDSFLRQVSLVSRMIIVVMKKLFSGRNWTLCMTRPPLQV